MKIFTLKEPTAYNFRKTAAEHKVVFDPMRDYVLSNPLFFKLEGLREKCLRISNMESRLKPFVAKPNNGRKLLYYTGAGGYGDELMSWPVASILAKMGYAVHVLVNPGNELLWSHIPFVKGVYHLPVEASFFELFDDVALFEVVTNGDQHLDQQHPVDNLLLRMGVDPSSVAASDKYVRAPIPESDRNVVNEQLGDRDMALYQVSATAQHRSLPPQMSAHLFGQLVRAFPKLHWLAVYDTMTEQTYAEEVTKAIAGCPNAELAKFASIRMGIAVAEKMKVIVSPDSFSMHLAGVLGVPCVGLWGSTAPEQRACYYPKHFPIWPRNNCPMSPCWFTQRTFPPHCPPLPEPRKVCAVLGSISAEDAIAAVQQALAAA